MLPFFSVFRDDFIQRALDPRKVGTKVRAGDLGPWPGSSHDRESGGMDNHPRTSPPDASYDDDRPMVDDTDDEVEIPLDPPFEVPITDALEQSRTVVLDDDRDGDTSG